MVAIMFPMKAYLWGSSVETEFLGDRFGTHMCWPRAYWDPCFWQPFICVCVFKVVLYNQFSVGDKSQDLCLRVRILRGQLLDEKMQKVASCTTEVAQIFLHPCNQTVGHLLPTVVRTHTAANLSYIVTRSFKVQHMSSHSKLLNETNNMQSCKAFSSFADDGRPSKTSGDLI